MWTDAWPNAPRGDVDGNGISDDNDREQIEEFIDGADGDDGQVDGLVVIPGFGIGFSIFDLDYNGVVNGWDALLAGLPEDADDDGDADLADFARFQVCRAGPSMPYPEDACVLVDMDTDGDVDSVDTRRWTRGLTGPLE